MVNHYYKTESFRQIAFTIYFCSGKTSTEIGNKSSKYVDQVGAFVTMKILQTIPLAATRRNPNSLAYPILFAKWMYSFRPEVSSKNKECFHIFKENTWSLISVLNFWIIKSTRGYCNTFQHWKYNLRADVKSHLNLLSSLL